MVCLHRPGCTVVQVYSLNGLEARLKNGVYKAMTDGRFSEGLRQVNALLHLVPLTVVETRREVDELKELLTIARCALAAQATTTLGRAPAHSWTDMSHRLEVQIQSARTVAALVRLLVWCHR